MARRGKICRKGPAFCHQIKERTGSSVTQIHKRKRSRRSLVRYKRGKKEASTKTKFGSGMLQRRKKAPRGSWWLADGQEKAFSGSFPKQVNFCRFRIITRGGGRALSTIPGKESIGY